MSTARDGPGLPEITRDGSQRPANSVRRRARAGRAPGSVLITVAAWLLALIGGSALFVSFSAQYAYIVTIRRQNATSVIEALLLDLLMIVFTLLALGLSRDGQSARAERALILACAAASAWMNVAAANVASPRSVAAYAVAPVALAVGLRAGGRGRADRRQGEKAGGCHRETHFNCMRRFLRQVVTASLRQVYGEGPAR